LPYPGDLLGNLPEFSNYKNSYLTVNNFLQTIHPQIYACGNWLRGYNTKVLAKEEAKYVAHQILSRTLKNINYNAIPFGIDLDPPFYRIGLTKAEADRQGIEINQIIYGFEPYHDHCDLRGVCKLITDRQDRILGAHWFGSQAKAGINLFNLAIAKGIGFSELQDLPLAEALGIEKWEI
jgi:pyruvate/2-oxoglutarate dehydrogenase complex dihydrolipoamide dehydrogenase (E3) component